MRELAMSSEVAELLTQRAPVAVGVSGGKDSCACAYAVAAHLDRIGHRGPRLLIHSDLGRIEWRDSLPTCQRLAQALGWELVVIRRAAGDLLARWQTRWHNNVARYQELRCVKLILPWSTPAMRFCTSELKTDEICRALSRRFPGQTIVSVSGIRREESAKRAKAPICALQKKLASTTRRTCGWDWHAILDWTTDEVFAYLAEVGFAVHEAYRVYGCSRVSCVYCIMASAADLRAATTCADNAVVYRQLVDLETVSTFAFQGQTWLGDVAPQLLSAAQRQNLREAKRCAAIRVGLERQIPKHLLYTQNWPTAVPTRAEAQLLAEVRRGVADAVGLAVRFTEPDAIVARYQELMDQKRAKEKAAA